MIEYGTIAAIIGILTFLSALVGAAIKILMYINKIRGEISDLESEIQKDLIKVAEDNTEFRLTAQKEISDLTLKIEREFVRKTP